jgi:hypothetical protein
MADDAHFYRQRATAEQANADAALLDNVRERCQRAADSWSAMAIRAERTQTLRDTREAATAAARDRARADAETDAEQAA